MKPLLLIPAFNEETSLPRVLDDVAASAPELDVVVVDDGSADGTSAVARGCGARTLRHPINLGYGAALHTGYRYALRRAVPAIVQMDADGQHAATDADKLLAPVLAGELDIAIGSRFLGAGSYRMGRTRDRGRRFFLAIARAFGLSLTDPTSGLQALSSRTIEFFATGNFPWDYPDLDVLLAAHRQGLRIGEIPVAMRESPRTSTLHSGIKPLYYTYKILLSTGLGLVGRRSPLTTEEGPAS